MTRILCYHSVDAGWQSSLAIDPETFAGQAEWMARNLEVLPLERALGAMDRTGLLPRGTTSLTFDDGYEGVPQHAIPTLARLGLPAALFVVSGTLDGSVHANDWLDDRDRGGRDIGVMSADAIRTCADAGWTIGSHSHLHRDLTELSEHECEDDLRTSREALESLLHGPVTTVAYPRGRNTEHVRRAASRAGFTHGLSLPEERERPGPMAVPRVGIYRGDGVRALRAKLSRWYLPFRTSPAFPVAQRALQTARRLRGGAG